MEIEKVLGDNLFKYFDWVAGTSTGAFGRLQLADCLPDNRVYWRIMGIEFSGLLTGNLVTVNVLLIILLQE